MEKLKINSDDSPHYDLEISEKNKILFAVVFMLFINGYLSGGSSITFLNILSQGLVYACISMMVLRICVDTLIKKQTAWQIFSTIMLLIIATTGKGVVAFTVFIILGIYLISVDDVDILNVYRWTVTIGLICCVVLSVIGITPLFSNEGLVTFGYNNQNSIALYFITATMLWIRSIKSIMLMFIYVIAVIIECVILNFYWHNVTGIWMLIGYIGLLAFLKMQAWKYVKFLGMIVPVLCFLFVVGVGHYYSEISGLESFNEFLNQRPLIWNEYLSKAGFNIFGASTDVKEAFFGPIDGAYLSMLLQFGIIWTIFVLFSLCRLNFVLGKQKNWEMLALAIIMEISGISEGRLMVIYATPIAVLAIKYVCVSSKTPTVRNDVNKQLIVI